MNRKKSTILEHPLTPKQEKRKMPRKISAADLKTAIREAKATVRAAKKAVTAAQKAFIDEPTQPNGKAYRNAVSEHIRAVQTETALGIRAAA